MGSEEIGGATAPRPADGYLCLVRQDVVGKCRCKHRAGRYRCRSSQQSVAVTATVTTRSPVVAGALQLHLAVSTALHFPLLNAARAQARRPEGLRKSHAIRRINAAVGGPGRGWGLV